MATNGHLCLVSHGNDVDVVYLLLILGRLREVVDLRTVCTSYGTAPGLALAFGSAESHWYGETS